MTINTTVVSNAIDLVNKANQTKIEQQAAALVEQILRVNDTKAGNAKDIADLQKALNEVANDTITPESIGTTLPTDASTDTASQATVRSVISNLNKNKQDDIKVRSSRLVTAIQNKQNDQVSLDKQLADLQAKLGSLAAQTVTVEQVTPAADN